MADPLLTTQKGSRRMVTGTPGPGRTGRPRPPEVDEAILSTAMRMLAEAGYARLTMDAVATRAGVGKASLYRRFPTKERLVLAAIRHRFEDGRPTVPNTGTLYRDMLSYLRALIRYRQAQTDGLQAVVGEVMVNPELATEFRRQVADGLLAGFRAILERAAGRGELPPGTDVDLLAILPLALLHHMRVLAGEPVDERQAKRIADQFFAPGPAGRPARAAAGGREGAGSEW